MPAGTPFKGIINVDVRDSTPDWEPFISPKAPDGAGERARRAVTAEYPRPSMFSGGAIIQVEIGVGEDLYVDLEKEAASALARE